MKNQESSNRMDIYDVMGIMGLLLLGTGLWMVSPALALSVVGALLVIAGLFGSWAKAAGGKRGK